MRRTTIMGAAMLSGWLIAAGSALAASGVGTTGGTSPGAPHAGTGAPATTAPRSGTMTAPNTQNHLTNPGTTGGGTLNATPNVTNCGAAQRPAGC